MEFLKISNKQRSFLSEAVYVILNILLSVALLLIIRYTSSLLLALVLVILSKWRVFAVRSRFWWANIQANAVCFVVSLSYVFLLFSLNLAIPGSQGGSFIVQAVLASLYASWLIFLKPQSKQVFVVIQSAVALFLGLTVVYMLSYQLDLVVVTVLTGVIGYISARHALSTYEEDRVATLSLAYSFLVAEISWVAYHWMIAYKLPGLSFVNIPQASLIVLLVSFIFYKVYDALSRSQKNKMNDIAIHILFSVILIVILLIFGDNTIFHKS